MLTVMPQAFSDRFAAADLSEPFVFRCARHRSFSRGFLPQMTWGLSPHGRDLVGKNFENGCRHVIAWPATVELLDRIEQRS